ncbi:lycopene cyclase domain-containing protein [Nocardia implantans]|uniref:Lycopene cyclase domain-containing protein n=1 Tax=Nocardia implantans TaxID=3108168 RepID=A0ABU6AWP0_9NOCA|nr:MULTISPECIES: lycopene cyclase domain-containing protein [unclassified Nocardia]MBF6193929.1 lycopene cyclase domain-containing protein [Nocardia beijingensis]MEA3529332.1 lycopene cyclase domain-containing protein [Nocardia sp. CDC192]MEB3511918.1 lycopene cyclase domain-containing protein [Nocardia sp. CDC186]
MDHWRYLLVLLTCLVLTAPLEFLGGGVYRRPRLLLGALLPAVTLFVVWDLVAIAAGVWDYNSRYLLGVFLPGTIPLEELLFFLVVPLCGLLTYDAVETLLGAARRRGSTSPTKQPRR